MNYSPLDFITFIINCVVEKKERRETKGMKGSKRTCKGDSLIDFDWM